MRKVIGIGETMLDIIFKNGKPIEAVPGGSTFNGIISLGRAGVNATFISETGSDRVGEYVRQFLKQNNVDTASVNVYPDSKSPVSLAFLDDSNNADYIFYREQRHDHMDFTYPDINRDDVVCSDRTMPSIRICVRRCQDCSKSPDSVAPSSTTMSTSDPHTRTT